MYALVFYLLVGLNCVATEELHFSCALLGALFYFLLKCISLNAAKDKKYRAGFDFSNLLCIFISFISLQI